MGEDISHLDSWAANGGVTLLHVYPVLAMVGIVAYYLIFAWLVVVSIYLIHRKALPIAGHIPYVLLPLVVVGLNQVPYSFWAGIGGVRV